jgi:hypothetical protein
MSPEEARALREALEEVRRKQPQRQPEPQPKDGRIVCGHCNHGTFAGKPCPYCGGKGFRQFPLPDEDG